MCGGGTYTYINIHTHTNTNIVKNMHKCVTGILDRFTIYACVGQRGRGGLTCSASFTTKLPSDRFIQQALGGV